MNTAETARKALEILEEDGWCKFALTYPLLFDDYYSGSRVGSHCIGGAWNLALHGRDKWLYSKEAQQADPSYELIASVIRSQYPDFEGSGYWLRPWLQDIGFIADWNNSPDTTEEDVRRVLEKVAAA